ncbi:ATP-binding cassette domain-containing protein [Mycobacterium sp. smrl_JER01]|uniref:ATP-binding cassette domain-containing protein n=1 Tax=Mycobacterium sp. smrl_JER01 TaxID=3402633 RepID=UPI003ABFAD5F
MSDAPGPEPAIVARTITLRGPWGPVYGPVDLEIEAGGVTILVCPPGSGRTALLMTLAGRMRPDSGSLSVFGRTRVREIFAHAALAAIESLDDVAESVTVRDLITEQLRWDARWYKLIRRADEAALARICGPVFGDLPLPPLSEYVEELTELDGLLLRIALADTAKPPLLVVGDIEQVTSDHHRELLVSRLVELGRTQTVVTASTNGVRGDLVRQIAVRHTSRADMAEQQAGA